MTTTPPPAAPRWRTLDPRQRRVLGVLIEKAKTTPAGYPMSVNALVAGCNQKNNRDPITAYDEEVVEETLVELIRLGVVSEVDWMGRVPKYKHAAYEWFGVDRAELAVLAELLLRGAQSLGDLRARAARMEPIEDLTALKPIVERLVARRLVVELTPAGRGQMVTHGLHTPGETPAAAPGPPTAISGVSSLEPVHAAGGPPATAAGPAAARGELDELRAELEALRERVSALERKLSP